MKRRELKPGDKVLVSGYDRAGHFFDNYILDVVKQEGCRVTMAASF